MQVTSRLYQATLPNLYRFRKRNPLRHFITILWILVFSLVPAAFAHAQNTSKVSGPVVDIDDRGLQYRLALIGGDEDEWSQRFQYRHAISDNFRSRFIVATRERDGKQVDFNYLRLEGHWQLTPDERPHQMGVRVEGRLRFKGAEEIRVNVLNQWSLGDGWRARAMLLNKLQVADRSNKELRFSTRLALSRKMEQGFRLGVHGFFDLGDTGGLNVLNDRSTSEFGPFVSFNLLEKTDLYLGTLHGVSDASPDTQLRLILTQSF